MTDAKYAGGPPEVDFEKGDPSLEIGPIKMDMSRLHDKSTRVSLRREKGPRYPFPVPNGWFVVAESRDLAPGELTSLYAFAKDLVLFRTESGEPRLVEAYCAHMGAHIGTSGQVEGESIRCPFHGWRYEGASGKCDHIPYAENGRIPPGAKLRSYPVIERAQMIWAWNHLEEAEPNFGLPEMPEFTDPEWLPYAVARFEVNTITTEILENQVDLQHFKFVHGLPMMADPKVAIGMNMEFDGPIWRNGGVAEHYGLGCLLTSFGDSMRVVESILPLDEENVKATFFATAHRSLGEDASEKALKLFRDAVTQDMEIWENKRYPTKPMLLGNEKKIARVREWALQFYSGYEP